MKRLLLFVLLIASACGFAQKHAGTAADPVPVAEEPDHHLVFENEYVRVFKVTVPPHAATLVHRHDRDYVVVTIGNADVTNEPVGKAAARWQFKDGAVKFLKGGFAHRAVNESDKPFVNYTVELKNGLGENVCGSECKSEVDDQACKFYTPAAGADCAKATARTERLFRSGVVKVSAVQLQGKAFTSTEGSSLVFVVSGSAIHVIGFKTKSHEDHALSKTGELGWFAHGAFVEGSEARFVVISF